MNRIFSGLVFLILVATSALAAPSRPAAESSACMPLTIAPKAYPPAVTGKEYREPVALFGGTMPVALTVTAGVLPPGMTLSPSGMIQGTPKASGRYGVTIRASDNCKPLEQSATQEITLIVRDPGKEGMLSDVPMTRKGSLKVSVSPEPGRHDISPGTTTAAVRYRLTATPPETATLDSPGASFLTNGAVITSVSAPLTAVFVNGACELGETITIPQKVIDYMRREKGNTFIYSRPFIGRGTTALAVVEFKLVTEKK